MCWRSSTTSPAPTWRRSWPSKTRNGTPLPQRKRTAARAAYRTMDEPSGAPTWCWTIPDTTDEWRLCNSGLIVTLRLLWKSAGTVSRYIDFDSGSEKARVPSCLVSNHQIPKRVPRLDFILSPVRPEHQLVDLGLPDSCGSRRYPYGGQDGSRSKGRAAASGNHRPDGNCLILQW